MDFLAVVNSLAERLQQLRPRWMPPFKHQHHILKLDAKILASPARYMLAKSTRSATGTLAALKYCPTSRKKVYSFLAEHSQQKVLGSETLSLDLEPLLGMLSLCMALTVMPSTLAHF